MHMCGVFAADSIYIIEKSQRQISNGIIARNYLYAYDFLDSI
ncbi:unnamed protein product [Ectocarpus sp. CCAP 1310/34]|nr:unnamed protein product [Ectocarpus sp. CCAP 1310/34]